jgi:hypothetical protein
MTNELNLEGDPNEVLPALMRHDVTTGVMGKLMHEFEEQVNESGWDNPPMLWTCYRDLPPAALADGLSEMGVMAMAMGMRNLELPEDIYNVPPWVWLTQLANTLSDHEDVAEKLLAGHDLIAWVLVFEAWVTVVGSDDWNPEENQPKVPPSESPDRMECRVLHAVDRAGYRYTVVRQRENDDVHMFADTRDSAAPDTRRISGDGETQIGMFGPTIEALTKLMEATPEPVDL